MSYTNTTIDDTDFSIVYSGSWDPSSDIAVTSLDYGGQHQLSEHGGTATFSFTGVAVYFWSPLWPYLVNTMVSVDGQDSTCLNLQDFSGATSSNGMETQQSVPVWGVTGLANGQHTLLVSGCPGGPFVVLDAITYTQYTPPPPSSSLTFTSAPAMSTYKTTTVTNSSHRTAIVAGSVVAGVVVALLLIFGFALIRRRNRQSEPIAIAEPPMTQQYVDPFNSPPANYRSPVSYERPLTSPPLPELT